jgi:hypothetical protein
MIAARRGSGLRKVRLDPATRSAWIIFDTTGNNAAHSTV